MALTVAGGRGIDASRSVRKKCLRTAKQSDIYVHGDTSVASGLDDTFADCKVIRT